MARERSAFTRAPDNCARQETIMAKEQKRGNREAKKPKAIKAPADPNPTSMLTGSLTPIKAPKKAR